MVTTVTAELGGAKRLQLHTRNFTETDMEDFAVFLEHGMAESIGIVLLFIENWHKWAFESLIDAFPSFPVRLLHEVNGGLKHAMLPVFGDDIDSESKLPFLILPPSVLARIYAARTMGGSAYTVDLRRWKRLNECPYWIYPDIFFVFTNWDSTLEVVRFHLESKERDLFNSGARSPIFHQTRELHRDASTTLALQECLRMHAAALKAFQLALPKERRYPYPAFGLMKRRLKEVAELLDLYQLTCVTVLEQQRNLLSMTFNLETVGQSQTVMRLNALAFVFLLLSLIAVCSGSQRITLHSPVWYIPVALSTLIATVGAVFITNRATDYLQSHVLDKPSLDQQQHETSTSVIDGQSPDQQQLEIPTRIFDKEPPDQQQPEPSTGVLNGQSLGQLQHETSSSEIERRSRAQQLEEAYQRSTLRRDLEYRFNSHSSDEQQPEGDIRNRDRKSPDQRREADLKRYIYGVSAKPVLSTTTLEADRSLKVIIGELVIGSLETDGNLMAIHGRVIGRL
ncbi:uncharacterized protein Triagg1_4321 [Trichoderma aggressivum f. europaeum]|uniref:Uncharacterized protein n=1 Tax=Trichoderma aggressivum f. europaeum TaxID=173218 RepID=A0AAE1M3T3_9HYPO|nr:hypothetical protein Triagg1_4321 [Trichoderma aggressivum f. europaeum]